MLKTIRKDYANIFVSYIVFLAEQAKVYSLQIWFHMEPRVHVRSEVKFISFMKFSLNIVSNKDYSCDSICFTTCISKALVKLAL